MPKAQKAATEPVLPLDDAPQAAVVPATSPKKTTKASKQAVAIRDPQKAAGTVVALSEAEAMMNLIDRAARDPNVDVEKMDRLLQMRDRIRAQEAQQNFNVALTAAQMEMRPIAADAKNKSTNSEYATYRALDRAMRPIYTKHGFSLSFGTADGAPEGEVRVICEVANGGHSKIYHVDMPKDGKGAKGGDVMTKTHATGAAVTYGQRYLLKMIFNITVGADDDGNYARRAGPDVECITQEQMDALIEKCEAVNCPRPTFLKWAKVERFEDIPADTIAGCMEGLNSFKKKAQ